VFANPPGSAAVAGAATYTPSQTDPFAAAFGVSRSEGGCASPQKSPVVAHQTSAYIGGLLQTAGIPNLLLM
jgi:hypothetical protein